MKSNFNPKLVPALLLFMVNLIHVNAQPLGQPVSSGGQAVWSSNPFDQKVFIRNEGQFSLEKIQLPVSGTFAQSPVSYGASSSGVNMYFTRGGMVWEHTELVAMTEPEIEARMEEAREIIAAKWGPEARVRKDEQEEERERDKMKKQINHHLAMEWVGSNPEAEIVAGDKVDFYYTYGETETRKYTIKAGAFRKITYKNLYPGIDVEYVLPDGSISPEMNSGLKYTLIVHPGADLSQVKMRYHGAQNMTVNAQGNLVLQSTFGEFTDHAPVAFCRENGQPVKIAFRCRGNEISFNAGAYPSAQTLVVDPWTSNPLFLTFNDCYDVNFDLNGNVYAYGSMTPFKLVKYNSAGALQWVFNAIGVNGSDYGDFAVDESFGTCYIVEGWNATIPAVILKVNTLGVQTGLFPGNANIDEMWRAEYNRCIERIVIGAGGTGSTFQTCILDTTLTSLTPVNSLNTTDIGYHDISLLAIDPIGTDCYMSTTRSLTWTTFDNVIFKVPLPALAPMTWSRSSAHQLYEYNCVNYNFLSVNANGFNGMACSPGWLYTYDSDSLKRWDKATGNYSAGIHVSATAATYGNGIVIDWGGLAVDECDNLYAGNDFAIKQYNSSLVQTGTIPLPNRVRDLKIGLNNRIYACGIGFVSEINLPPNSPTLSLSSTPACSTCLGTATVNTNSCGSNPAGFTYAWNTVPVQNTQTATNLCPGTYTVTVTRNCFFSDTASVVVNTSVLLPNLGPDSSLCVAPNFVLSPGAGFASYAWSDGSSAPTLAVTTSGTYSVTTTDLCGNAGSDTITLTVQPSGVNLGPDISVCPGQSVLLDAGTSGTSYLWSDNSTNQTLSVNAAGAYSVTVTNSDGCSASDTLNLSIIPPPVVNLGPDISLCSGSNVVLNAGNPGMTFLWSDGSGNQTLPVTSAGSYSVTVTNSSGCTGTDLVNVNFYPLPVVNLGNDVLLCPGETATLDAGNAGSTFSWSTGAGTQTIQTNTGGTFSVTITDVNGCTGSDAVVVNIAPQVMVNLGPDQVICEGQTLVLDAGNTGYSFVWSDGSTSQTLTTSGGGTYAVTVTSTTGCSGTDEVLLSVQPDFIFQLGPDTTLCSDEPFVIEAGMPGKNYQWFDGSTGPSAEVNETGDYWVEVSDNCYTHLDTIHVELIKGMPGPYVPNTFTPNGDGLNDLFRIEGLANSIYYHLIVFDRWGNLIYETHDPAAGWDGRINNREASEGVYAILYEAADCMGSTRYVSGTVTLLR